MGSWTAGIEITSSRLHLLRGYWGQRCGIGGMPGRRDIDPVDIPHLLPHIALVDIERVPLRFRYRLVGTRMVEVLGWDPTGQYLDSESELGESAVLSVLAPIMHVVSTAEPLASSGRIAWDNGSIVDSEWIFLPLSDDGCQVTMVLIGADFFSRNLQYPEGRPHLELNPAFSPVQLAPEMLGAEVAVG
jgi:hypothetical protein